MRKITFLRSLLAAIAFAAAFPFIAATARGASGEIFETNGGTILRFTSAGGTPGTFATGLSNPKGIVFDGRGHVYVADAGRNAVLTFTVPDGTGATFASGLSSPIGLAFDTNGFLYVADSGSSSILKFAQDGTKTTFATAVGSPAGLAFDN